MDRDHCNHILSCHLLWLRTLFGDKRIPYAASITHNLLPTVNSTVVFILSIKSAGGIYTAGVNSVLLQNVTMYNAPGMAYLFITSTDITLSNVYLLKRPGVFDLRCLSLSRMSGTNPCRELLV